MDFTRAATLSVLSKEKDNFSFFQMLSYVEKLPAAVFLRAVTEERDNPWEDGN